LTAVVAAGNDGKGVSSPGCASGAIAVGAVDSSNNVPYWSGRGKALDIVAPGVSIYSTLINGYGTMSGTSMATPHVAGVVALLLDANSGLTTSEIKNAIYNTANPVNKCYKCTLWLGTSCYRQAEVTCTFDITGKGVVDAYDAYLYVMPSTTTTTIPTTTTLPTTTTTTSSTTTTPVTTTMPATTTTPTKTKCWSGTNQYLYSGSSQAKKFCKCAQGTYGYKSYSYSFGTKKVYYYVNIGDNTNWSVSSRSSYLPVYRVICTNGQVYPTNQDYYYG